MSRPARRQHRNASPPFLICLTLATATIAAGGNARAAEPGFALNRFEPIHPEGVRRRTIFSTKALRWDEILEYRYKSTFVAAGGTLGALGGVIDAYGARTGTNRSLVLTLVGSDGRRLELNSNLSRAAEAIDLVLQRVHARTMPDLERRLETGEPLRFGNVELSVRGVCEVGDTTIPLDHISSVEIQGTRLRIKRTGDFFAHCRPRSLPASPLIPSRLTAFMFTPSLRLVRAPE